MKKFVGSIMVGVGIIFLISIFHPKIIFGEDWANPNNVGIVFLPPALFAMLFGLLSIIMGIGVICDWYKK